MPVTINTANSTVNPVRTGIIGCGVIGRFHLKEAAASPLLEVTAIADVCEQAACDAAQSAGVDTVYSSAEKLLADERIEAVVLALPAYLRTKIALDALAAGKHVLIEKPIAMNTTEVRALIDAHGTLTVACCSARFSLLDAAEKARNIIAAGQLGKLRSIHCRVISPAGAPPTTPPPAWRLNKALNGGGIFVNWGSYDLDFLMSITGWKLKPEVVFAQSWPISSSLKSYAAPDSNAETHLVAMLSCANGTVINYERAETACAAAESSWHITGDKAALRIQMVPNKNIPAVVLDEISSEGVVSKIILKHDNSFAEQHGRILNDFAAAVRKGNKPSTDLRRSLILQKITDAAYASVENRTAVDVDKIIENL